MKNRLFFALCIYLFILSSCANIVAPSGGKIDSTAPEIKKAVPENFSRNFNSGKIFIQFNEYINLKDASGQIIISPEISGTEFKLRKKAIEIKLGSVLKENTTYTINFGNAVSDFTESNINKELRYVFSTSDEIDSLKLKGKLVNAFTTEKESGVPIYLYQDFSDSLLYTTKPYYATRTDENGEFTFENIKEGDYFLASLKESNNNKIYDSQDEEISFYSYPVHIHADTNKYELRSFKESPVNIRLTDKKFDDKSVFLSFNKPVPTLSIEILSNDSLKNESYVWYNAERDSAKIYLSKWVDSLQVKISDQLLYSDTIVLKRFKRKNTIPQNFIGLNVSEIMAPGKFIHIRSLNPITLNASLDSVIIIEDSIRYNIIDRLARTDAFTYKVNKDLSSEKKYELILKDSSFHDNSNTFSKSGKYNIIIRSIETYGNIQMKINAPDGSYLIQMLDAKNTILKTDTLNGSQLLTYTNYNPGEYKLRVIFDENKNGKWDTGNFLRREQPEKIIYYPGNITLRANWDLEMEYTFN